MRIKPDTTRTADLLHQVDFPIDTVKYLVNESERIEKSGTASIWEASRPTAEAYGILASEIAKHFDGYNQEVALLVGKSLERLVYVTDMTLDYWQDSRSGAYNPLVQQAHTGPQTALDAFIAKNQKTTNHILHKGPCTLTRRYQAVNKRLRSLIKSGCTSIVRKTPMTRKELRSLRLVPPPSMAYSFLPFGFCFERDCDGNLHLLIPT